MAASAEVTGADGGGASPGSLPRILLATDVDLSAGSRGAGRTLVNLFSRYPADRLVALSTSHRASFETAAGHRVLPAAPGVPGRVAQWLRPRIGHVDAAWTQVRPLPYGNAVARFAPELVVAVPTNAVGVALAGKCAGLAPMVVYMMDDWLAHQPGARMVFDARARGRNLLRRAVAWLAISTYLSNAMRAFAGLERPAHVVHNAVRTGDAMPPALEQPRSGRFRVAYAGSVWPMHWGAVAAIAQGIQRLREAGSDMEFVLFTDRFFWGRHETHWRRWGVVDGGLVPYDALSSTLADCDLLLVASSFDPAQAHMSRSSLQTKVTDYMAAGRPILACGPADSASNLFLRERGCAYFAEDPSPAAIDAALRACVDDRAEGLAIARRAWVVAKRDHDIGAVSDALYAFLSDVARDPQR